ncbi:unnamed protein product [Pedinophyceae sp. YPF-701]|nr:unnamed protein product [Pedinophyceae sp. YPF-701]
MGGMTVPLRKPQWPPRTGDLGRSESQRVGHGARPRPHARRPEVVIDGESYRPNVGICLLNSDNKVFLGRRVTSRSQFLLQMPQGGMDAGEEPLQAAFRELQEETGITSVETVATIPRWLVYDFPDELRAAMSSSWRNYRGQAQQWFLMRFTGDDSEICLEQPGHKREFANYTWADLQSAPRTCVPFKRHVYEEVVREFAPIVQGGAMPSGVVSLDEGS